MDTIQPLRTSGETESADASDDTIINGAPYDAGNPIADAAIAVAVVTGEREEYRPDHGPDLDEPLDGTETGQEI